MDKRWHLSCPEEVFHLFSVGLSFELSFVLSSKSRWQDDQVTSQHPDDCAKIQAISGIKGHTRTELLHSQQTLLNSLGCNKASSLCRQPELNCFSYVFWIQRKTNTHSHAHTHLYRVARQFVLCSFSRIALSSERMENHLCAN